MATLILPVRSDFSAYQFQIDLEGVIYTLDFGFNTRADRWYMSIFDSSGEILLVGDIPILVNIPLADQYIDKRLPLGRFIAIDETGNNGNPGIDNFGTDIKLLYEESA